MPVDLLLLPALRDLLLVENLDDDLPLGQLAPLNGRYGRFYFVVNGARYITPERPVVDFRTGEYRAGHGISVRIDCRYDEDDDRLPGVRPEV